MASAYLQREESSAQGITHVEWRKNRQLSKKLFELGSSVAIEEHRLRIVYDAQAEAVFAVLDYRPQLKQCKRKTAHIVPKMRRLVAELPLGALNVRFELNGIQIGIRTEVMSQNKVGLFYGLTTNTRHRWGFFVFD